MKTFRTIKHAVLSLAVDHGLKPLHMFVEACKDDCFKKPMTDKHYSTDWLKHHLYRDPNINVFKKLLKLFPPEDDFKIKGFTEIFPNKSEALNKT